MPLTSKELSTRFANLSPEKRALLMRKLRENNSNHSSNLTIPRRTKSEFLPLSFSQERLWFLEQLEPGSPVYNMPAAIRLQGQLQPVLEKVLFEIQERHESLRTTFIKIDGKPAQVIVPTPNAPLILLDLTSLPAADKKRQVEQLATEEAQRPFNLVEGPLFRTTLLRLSDEEHVLLLTTHHIVSDGWSMEVLVRELTELYQAFSNGLPSPLADLPIQYADYAVWHRQWLQGEVLAERLHYWKQHLASAPPVLALPADRPRSAIQSFRGAYETVNIGKELSHKLRDFSRQWGGTLFMILLAAFKTLLNHYTGVNKIVVGTPDANRNRVEIEDLIGLFVNTLVLCTDMSGNPKFHALFDRIKKVTMDAYEHQDLPFEKLVEELRPQRDLSYSPLFQVMFILQTPSNSLELPNLTLSSINVHSDTAKFDLTLGVVDSPEGLIGAFEYNTDLFNATTIRRMAEHFSTLLQAIAANPEQRLSQLRFLTDSEKHLLLLRWNDTNKDYASDSCFHRLFERQVEQSPDSVAIVYENQQLTYSELNICANRLAHYLKKLGVGPEVLVGLCVNRSLDLIIGLLGILKAGGAYVPLDPTYPKQRLQFMLEDANVSVLLTQEHLLPQLPSHQATVLCLDRDNQSFTNESEANVECENYPGNLAYVIYTSGSTGQPKGVAVTQQNLVNFLTAMSEQPGLAANDVLVALTTTSFDIAGLELYLPLLVGAKVVLVSREIAADGRRLSTTLTKHDATAMQATPATWQLLIESGWQGKRNLKALCGGESLSPKLADDILERCAELWNMYGPTETTIWSSVRQMESSNETISIGRPIANTRMYILDKFLNPVPIGVYGELYISGDGLSRGYLNRPGSTANMFVANPFSHQPGSRFYRTGDLARYLPDGNIELVGRVDYQVKIRGFRIELGEIEAALIKHPAVTSVVAIVREDVEGDKRLTAYIVLEEETKIVSEKLRSFLQATIPDYMIPSGFIFLDSLPLTPNGKVDRKALPAPEGSRPELQAAFVAPQNEIERTIAGIWQNVLQVEKVGVDDNFFDLGGHSLLLIQVQSKLCDLFTKDLSIIDLFNYPTVKSLAGYFTWDQNAESDNRKFTDLARRQKDAMERQKRFMEGVKSVEGRE